LFARKILPAKNMQRVVFVVVLLCVGQWALGQDFDCSTSAGQAAYLKKETAPECYNPLLDLRNGTQPTAAQVEFVCESGCVRQVVEFLQSTEECRNNATVKGGVDYLQDQLCAYKDGEDPATSCALEVYNADIGYLVKSCIAWWYPESVNKTKCPPRTAPNTTMDCDEALKTATETDFGCCYKFLKIDNATRDDYDVPDDLEIDVTDPALFEVCGVSFPDMCKSQLTTTDSAQGLVATPLIAILLTIVAKLFA
jgi:hypothetical protein